MCSPLVADLYFSAQATMMYSPGKLALQIGGLHQRGTHRDAASVARLHHIDQVYRIALDGARYHMTSTTAHPLRRAALGGLPRPGTIHDTAIRRALMRGFGTRLAASIWIGFGAIIAIFLDHCGDR